MDAKGSAGYILAGVVAGGPEGLSRDRIRITYSKAALYKCGGDNRMRAADGFYPND